MSLRARLTLRARARARARARKKEINFVLLRSEMNTFFGHGREGTFGHGHGRGHGPEGTFGQGRGHEGTIAVQANNCKSIISLLVIVVDLSR